MLEFKLSIGEKGKKSDLRCCSGWPWFAFTDKSPKKKMTNDCLFVCLFLYGYPNIFSCKCKSTVQSGQAGRTQGHDPLARVAAGAGAPPLGEGHGSVFGPLGIPVGANSSKTTRTQCEVMKNSERLPPDEPKDFSCKACVSFLTLAHKEIVTNPL